MSIFNADFYPTPPEVAAEMLDPLDMSQGDLCVFDSDHGHAWLSNAACVMVMATVTRQRSIHSLEVKQ